MAFHLECNPKNQNLKKIKNCLIFCYSDLFEAESGFLQICSSQLRCCISEAGSDVPAAV